MLEIVDFLKWVIKRDRLEIADYFQQMGQDPFFLVAATGLGKTVGVPVHALLRQLQRSGATADDPVAVWVVEPRIPIAVDQQAFMNSLWQSYRQHKRRQGKLALFGCITSVSGNVNRDAPIKFVTTGIFEMLAKNGELDPQRDRVIIDEAHVTVEQNPGVELGIALARAAGVTVDYMSATVDTSNLSDALGVTNIIRADKSRFNVWKSNLLEPMDKAIVPLVEATLINPDPTSRYFPTPEYADAAAVHAAVFETGRSHGMLAVINSFAGSHSDARKIAKLLNQAFPQLPVLLLAGEVVRDDRRLEAFKAELAAIEARQQNYVIIATSVVEMGITFPTLDFVVTMDSGYDQETIGETTFPVVAPLGVNSLLQRIGRVGRRRPGIAYITHEVGADYAELEDDELNRPGALRYEAIRFPMASASMLPLAFYACKQGWTDVTGEVARLRLPSGLHVMPDRMAYLLEQITMLESLGIAEGGSLTEFGRRMEQWIGRADLAYATTLQRRLEEGASQAELLFWLVATTFSTTPVATLCPQHSYFVDYDGQHAELPHAVDVWSGHDHEDLALFAMLAKVSALMPGHFWNSGKAADPDDELRLIGLCNASGVDGRKLLKAARAIQEMWQVLRTANDGNETIRSFSPSAVDWAECLSLLDVASAHRQLAELPGVTRVALAFNESLGAFEWQELDGERQGIVSQEDSPIRLADGEVLARLVPGRDRDSGETSWRLSHLGAQPPQPVAEPEPTGLLARAGRLFRFRRTAD
ncbi:hypothetical protein JNJ66_05205 [Candidatus Saccharibacteria bacterium]|nr:hypothetical protein [Candidatus Saccharibacteria bacterium]